MRQSAVIALFVVTSVAAGCAIGQEQSTSNGPAPATATVTVIEAPAATPTVTPSETPLPEPTPLATPTLTPTPTGESLDLSVMSFNVRYDNPDDDPNWDQRLPAITRMLDAHQPDIVGTQEALVHQVGDLAATLPDHDWVGVGRDDGQTAGEFAAIHYRADAFDLLDTDTRWLSDTPDRPSRGWDAALERIVTWVELQPVGSDGSFFVFNTHFDHEGAVAREQSARLVSEMIDTVAGTRPAVLLGDLNVLPDDPVLDPLLASLTDVRAAAPLTDDVGSFNAFVVPAGVWSIDYVLVRTMEPVSFETVDDDYGVSFISDHFPVMATLRCGVCTRDPAGG